MTGDAAPILSSHRGTIDEPTDFRFFRLLVTYVFVLVLGSGLLWFAVLLGVVGIHDGA